MGRLLVPVLAALAAVLGPALPAYASCAPEALEQRAARAQIVVYGSVTETRQTFAPASPVIRFRPERVLKGTLDREVEVNLGPTHGGAPTSVDYTAVIRGERHTLYLRVLPDGAYETDVCSGSHAGAPTAEEERLLGPGTFVASAADGPALALLSLAAAALAIVAIVIAVAVRRRRAI